MTKHREPAMTKSGGDGTGVQVGALKAHIAMLEDAVRKCGVWIHREQPYIQVTDDGIGWTCEICDEFGMLGSQCQHTNSEEVRWWLGKEEYEAVIDAFMKIIKKLPEPKEQP